MVAPKRCARVLAGKCGHEPAREDAGAPLGALFSQRPSRGWEAQFQKALGK